MAAVAVAAVAVVVGVAVAAAVVGVVVAIRREAPPLRLTRVLCVGKELKHDRLGSDCTGRASKHSPRPWQLGQVQWIEELALVTHVRLVGWRTSDASKRDTTRDQSLEPHK